MNLKRQLFVASLLMLLIPWAGLQFVLELDDALRQQARQQLQEQAERLADVAGDALVGLAPVAPDQPAIYVESLAGTVNLDGYGDDWPGYEEDGAGSNWQGQATNQASGPTLQWQAATDERHLYLLIRVNHRQPVFFNPGLPNQPYDHLTLWLQPASGSLEPGSGQAWRLQTPAPGQFYGLSTSTGAPDYRVSGVWQGAGSGWQVELKLPVPPDRSRLGFRAQWSENPDQAVATATDPLPVLVRRRPLIERQLAPRLGTGQQVRLIEPAGWVIATQRADSGQTGPEFDSLTPLQVIEQISLNALRALIRFYQPEPAAMATGIDRLPPESLPDDGLVRHDDGSV
ncbi:MAG: histidine kinase, partial [Pseudomonadota bacterium]|nr:histidine kinase [Pseudomonadota bacterium]